MIKHLIGWFILLPISALLIIFALANRHLITLNFDPISADNPLIASLSIPLFVVIFIMLLFGILLGGIAVWFSQAKKRAQLNRARKNIKTLELELSESKKLAKRNLENKNIDNKSLLAPDDLFPNN